MKLVLVLIALAQEQEIPAVDLQLRVEASVEEVEFGAPFELRVIQAWDRKLELESWGDEKLQPLTVRLLDTLTRENETHSEEIRIYECFAFEIEQLTLPALFLRAKSREDGAQFVALGDELRLRVNSILPVEDDGSMELPRDVYPAPFPWALTLASLVLVSLVGGLVWRAYRRLTLVEIYVPPPPPHTVAAERLRELRGRSFETRAEVRSFHVETTAIVRTYIETRFDVDAPGKTTDEFFADPSIQRSLRSTDRKCLKALLVQSDLVKYAGAASGPDERTGLLDAIDGFVEETRERLELERGVEVINGKGEDT